MLIAPFSVSSADRSRTASPAFARPGQTRPPIGGLLAWLAIGIGVLLLVPLARGDRFFGATLPFWLVVAPLVDLGWTLRRRIARRVTESWREFDPRESGAQCTCSARAAAASCGVQSSEVIEHVVAIVDALDVRHRAKRIGGRDRGGQPSAA